MPQQSTTASKIIVNAKVRTLDPRNPVASSLAISGDTIIAVGNERDVAEYRGAGTELIDVGGHAVTPGLIDGHIHPFMGAKSTEGIDFAGVTTMEAFLALLRAEADRILTQEPGAWLRGWNLDYDVFGRQPITAALIEDAVRGSPTFIFVFDMHTALATPAAMRAAGITGSVTFGDASQIVVDQDGVPTGELREASAYDAVLAGAPAMSRAEVVRRSQDVLRRLNASGITGGAVMDGAGSSLDMLDELAATGDGLPVRLVHALGHAPERDAAGIAEFISMRDRRGERWRGGLIKMFADGVIDSGTGWLYEPDALGGGLDSFWPNPADYADVVRQYSEAGFQIATHAIGDRAIGAAIDAYVAAGVTSRGGAPHRIEHLECLADKDLARLAEHGITASMQPLHLQWRKADGSDAWAARMGPERTSRAWRTRDVHDAGVPLALGSDWPVAQLDARLGMAWARLRRTPGNPDAPVFEPVQVLNPLEALAGFTTGSARAQGDQDTLGRIAVGYKADLAVWAEDPVLVGSDALVDLPVSLTLVGGAVTYRAEE
ncbi:amidohydrolase [Saxibacter everestensis]|uniref:Amidohydrolase n=1 Tax=Saxibacter everestensis TaxID=2909229 RepID=A0ABY8QR80_9MICO|nr:amidohydrolase [Brevibacteriaceae bacterium ZFBP1038]